MYTQAQSPEFPKHIVATIQKIYSREIHRISHAFRVNELSCFPKDKLMSRLKRNLTALLIYNTRRLVLSEINVHSH